jgi:hypothetical protein
MISTISFIVILSFFFFVILSEAKDLLLGSAESRSFASLRMTTVG